MADSISDPKVICFYAYIQTDDEEYLNRWAAELANTIQLVVNEACDASEGKVWAAAPTESTVAHPVREEPPKDRDEV